MRDSQKKHKKRISEFTTTPVISARMSHVPHERGKSEVMLSKALWHRGIRYRVNYKKLPGSPDIAITKYKIAIFVDGELWHGFEWEKRKEQIHSNREYWLKKIELNIERDRKNDELLKGLDWSVIHLWSHEVTKNVEKCTNIIIKEIECRANRISP